MGVPTIVQTAALGNNVGAASVLEVSWGAAPTEGNLLVVMGFRGDHAAITPGSGWFLKDFQTGPNWTTAIYLKIAGASEPTTSVVDTATATQWGLGAWELTPGSNVAVQLLSDTQGGNVNVTGDSSFTVPSFTTQTETSMILGVAAGNNAAITPTGAFASGSAGASFSGASVDGASTFEYVGTADFTGSVGGVSFDPTIDFSSTGSGANVSYAFLELTAPSSGPVVDSLIFSEETGQSVTSGGSISVAAQVLTTGEDTILVVIGLNTQNSGGTLTPSVTASGLTFALRATGIDGNQALWAYYAPATDPVNVVVTAEVMFSGAPGDAVISIYALGISGGDLASPFDPNASFPLVSPGSPASWTTDDADDLLFSAMINDISSTPPALDGTWTEGPQRNDSFGGAGFASSTWTKAQPSAGGGTTSWTTSSNIQYFDAFTPFSSAPTTAVGTAAGAGAAAGVATVLETAVGLSAGHGAAESFATGIMPATGHAAGMSGVVGIGNVLGVLEPLFDWEATVISQYQTSPTLLQLIENMETYIDPLTNLDAFYVNIWNIYSASGYGLDVWGRIVGVTRTIRVPTPTKFLGFRSAAPSVESYDFGILFDGSDALTQNYTLSDQAFRTLILAKALANICNGSIPAMNQILINLFNGKGYGNVYVTDGEDMTMTITFTNAPSAVDLAIISTSGVFPRPAGVDLSVVT